MGRTPIIIFLLSLSLNFSTQAHPGRTDAKGGHLNKSTGEYHHHTPREWVESWGTVTKAIDGDTFDINIEGVIQRVRLLGVNAPEMDTIEGKKIKKAFVDQITGKKVRLKHQNYRDKYARLLAEVYINGESIARKVKTLMSG